MAVAVGAAAPFGQSFEGDAHRVPPLCSPLGGGARAAAGHMEAVFGGQGEGLGQLWQLRQADRREVGAEFLRENALFVQGHFDHLPLDVQSLT